MKESIRKMLCIMLVVSMSLFLAGCGNKDVPAEEPAEDESEITMDDIESMEGNEEEDYDNGIYFEEEMDGAEVVTQKKDAGEFVGSWTATSGQALYQYGNVDITVEADGKWSGNISDEALEGTWKESGDGIYLTSDIFECQLAFSESGALIMQYSPDEEAEEYITTVLSKK